MSSHACSTSPCPSCEPRDYQAARTLARNDAERAELDRYIAAKDEVMGYLLGASDHSDAADLLLAKIKGA